MPAVKFFTRLDLDQICLFLDGHYLVLTPGGNLKPFYRICAFSEASTIPQDIRRNKENKIVLTFTQCVVIVYLLFN